MGGESVAGDSRMRFCESEMESESELESELS